MKSIISNNILFFTKINIIMHFPWGFVHISSAVRTKSLDMHGLDGELCVSVQAYIRDSTIVHTVVTHWA